MPKSVDYSPLQWSISQCGSLSVGLSAVSVSVFSVRLPVSLRVDRAVNSHLVGRLVGQSVSLSVNQTVQPNQNLNTRLCIDDKIDCKLCFYTYEKNGRERITKALSLKEGLYNTQRVILFW